MTSTDIVLTVLGSSVVLTVGWLLKNHLKNRSEEKMLALDNAQRVALSQEETRRLEVVTQAMKMNSALRQADAFAVTAHDSPAATKIGDGERVQEAD